MSAVSRPSPIKVLVVDDDADITSALKLGLGYHKIAVDVCNDPIEALRTFEPGAHDVIILDMRMPGMDGRALCEEMMKRDKSIVVGFLTAFDSAESGGMPRVLRSVRMMRKPISIAELASAIREMASAATAWSGKDGAIEHDRPASMTIAG